MFKQVQKRKQSGFTLIEVLIVLAIAGLIMLVVFLAVPALNRNAHNNQTSTEARNILGAYQELSNNNGGSPLVLSSVAATDATNVLKSANTKTITSLTIVAATTTAQTPAVGKAIIVENSICTSQSSNVPAGGTARNIALYYQIESKTGTTYQCITE